MSTPAHPQKNAPILFEWRIAAAAAPVVTITGLGSAVGTIASDAPDVGIFRGLPYAEPPVGARRWQAAYDRAAEAVGEDDPRHLRRLRRPRRAGARERLLV